VLHDQDLVERFADLVISLNPDQPEQWTIRALRPDDESSATRW
jgi:hypothetical protein